MMVGKMQGLEGLEALVGAIVQEHGGDGGGVGDRAEISEMERVSS